MSDSGGGEQSRDLGGFGYLAAIIMCCVIVGALAYNLGRENERRDDTPASYAKAAKADAQSACVGRETATAFECIYEKVEAAQEQARGEQDLSAQQVAANSAFMSAIIAFFTLILTGIGVWFIKGTLEATLEAVEDTGRATDTMVKANEIAAAQYRIGFKPWISVTATGNFVGYEDISMFKPGEGRRGLPVDLRVTLKNTSRMSAMITSVQTRWSYYPEQFFRPTECRRVLGPEDEIILNLRDYLPHDESEIRVHEILSFTSGMWDELRRNAPFLCFVVLYTDPLGIRHELGFAFGPTMLWTPSVRRAGNERENFDRVRPINDQRYREY